MTEQPPEESSGMRRRLPETCGFCRWFRPGPAPRKGVCMRYPPPRAPANCYDEPRPVVADTDYCGEYRPNP